MRRFAILRPTARGSGAASHRGLPMDRPQDRAPRTRAAHVERPVEQPRFETAWMTSAAWQVLRRRYLGLVLLLGALCFVGVVIAVVPVAVLIGVTSADAQPREVVVVALVSLAILFVYGVFGIAGAAVAHVVRAEVEGRSISVASAVGHALSRAHVVLAVQFVYTLSWVIGTMLLIAPGVFAAMYGFAAIPAAVHERIGPIEAFRRSFELCSRARGTAFAVLAFSVLGYFVAYVVSQCLGGLGMIPMMAGGMGGMGGGGGGGAGFPIGLMAVFAVFSLIGQVVQFVGMVWIWLLAGTYYSAGNPPSPDARTTSDIFR